MPITCLLLVLEVWDGKPAYRKSWAGNLLVWSDLTFGPLLQGQIRTAKLKSAYNLLTFLHNTIGRAQLFCPFLLSGSEFLLNMLFNYHLLYFCTALSLIIMLSSHYYLHKSKNTQSADTVPVHGHSPLVCRLQRITGYSKVPGMESWYRTELPKVNLVTENS